MLGLWARCIPKWRGYAFFRARCRDVTISYFSVLKLPHAPLETAGCNRSLKALHARTYTLAHISISLKPMERGLDTAYLLKASPPACGIEDTPSIHPSNYPLKNASFHLQHHNQFNHHHRSQAHVSVSHTRPEDNPSSSNFFYLLST